MTEAVCIMAPMVTVQEAAVMDLLMVAEVEAMVEAMVEEVILEVEIGGLEAVVVEGEAVEVASEMEIGFAPTQAVEM